MPRIARKNIGTQFAHIMVQGVNKEYIFDDDIFINYYLNMIKKYLQEDEFCLIAYCMMNNHAHFLFYIDNISIFEEYMKKINQQFAIFYNKAKNRVGVVFRNRYKVEPIYDINHLKNCIKYIHDNPVKAKMVQKCDEYLYSSYNEYKSHTGISNNKIIKQLYGDTNDYLSIFNNAYERKFIDYEDNKNDTSYIIAGIKQFEKKYGYNLIQILSERDILKELLIFVKKECNIKYKEMVRFLDMPNGILNNLKNHDFGSCP